MEKKNPRVSVLFKKKDLVSFEWLHFKLDETNDRVVMVGLNTWWRSDVSASALLHGSLEVGQLRSKNQ